MKTKRILILSILISSCFILSACQMGISLGESKADSGFFMSSDKATNWVQKSELLSVGGNRAFFKNTQGNFLRIDPNDPKALYLGTLEDGLFYSTDKGNSWSRTLVGKGTIHDLAIDPKFSCTMYAGVGVYLYKTNDCTRHWNLVYTSDGTSIKAIGVVGSSTNKVYIVLSDGRILKSEDSGIEWKYITKLTNASGGTISVQRIFMNQKDPQKIYIAAKNGGIFKSENDGYEWKNITSNMAESVKDLEKNKANDYKDMVIDPSKDDAFFYANSDGLFYTENGGASWERIKLISKKDNTVYSLASNPKNPSEIYYATSKLFYKSNDFGHNWSSKKLPTTKTVVDLLVDPENENNVFAITRDIKK